MLQLLSLIATLLLLSGCSTRGAGTYKYQTQLKRYSKPAQKNLQLDNSTAVADALYEEYMKWEGTIYKFGGTSKQGVDCSSFVQQLYFNALGIKVPRSTKEQAKIGRWIKKSQLRSGDLVLFKTAYNERHSGVYLEHGKFMNASSTYGVTLSNLNNPYWKAKYWQSRRVFEY